MGIRIKSLGSGLSLQDGGRLGWRRFGVPTGGAMDRYAMRMANQLLGNPSDAPVLEIRQQGTCIEVIDDIWLALAGADSCANLPSWKARLFRSGETLVFSERDEGGFSYLAAPGGWLGDRWFGSVSADLRSKIGKPILVNAQLDAATLNPSFSDERVASRLLPLGERRSYANQKTFGIFPGPQYGEFPSGARKALTSKVWTVSRLSDRTGFRLEGDGIPTAKAIKSEPVMLGSFQVPESGQPIVTMVDGPTVGGYPKIAVLADADFSDFAQCPPGIEVRFEWRTY